MSALGSSDGDGPTIEAASGEVKHCAITEGIGKLSISALSDDPPPKEECPICTLPMPFSTSGLYSGSSMIAYQPCCGKMVCAGCLYAADEAMEAANLPKGTCPFCRESNFSLSDEEIIQRYEKRMRAGDAEAFYLMGNLYNKGSRGLPPDPKKAMGMWVRAAQLGSLMALHAVALAYSLGEQWVEPNSEKALLFFGIAAMRGHDQARHMLGRWAKCKARAMEHFMIAASAGYEESLKEVGLGYKEGYVSKEQYKKTLCAFRDTRNEMKSDQRARADAAKCMPPVSLLRGESST